MTDRHPPAHRDGHHGVDFMQITSEEYRRLKAMKRRLLELIDAKRAETTEYMNISGGFSPEFEARATLDELLFVYAGVE